MKSPFPGMDPFLESHWRDIHHRLMTYACDAMQPNLPGSLRARLEERVFIEPDQNSTEGRGIYPDLLVVQRHQRGSGTALADSPQLVASEALNVQLEVEPAEEAFIEVIDVSSGNRVVTVVELLSLANKLPGKGREMYLKKQDEYRNGRTSLIEIDLLRRGDSVVSVPVNQIPSGYLKPYSVCVSRGWRPGYFELYRIPLQRRLPVIRIPLRETDEDVLLDLQPLIDKCYINGRYDDIDYRRPAEPPLEFEDATWANELIAKLP